ncbi:pilus assembly protein PilM [Candidatus Margulisiibacteriota bacterium]
MDLPASVNKEPLAVDIGTDAIKIVSLKRTIQKTFIDKYLVVPIPHIDKSHSYHQSIAELLHDTVMKNHLRGRKAFVTFSGDKVFYQHDTFPDMKKEDLIEAIRWKYKEQMDFPVETAVIDYMVIREVYEEDLKNLELFIILISRESIECHIEIAQAAGLSPVFLSFPPFSCFEFYEHFMSQSNTSEVIVWVEMGAKHSIVSVINSRKLDFARMISFGTHNLIEVVDKTPESIFVTFAPKTEPSSPPHIDTGPETAPAPAPAPASAVMPHIGGPLPAAAAAAAPAPAPAIGTENKETPLPAKEEKPKTSIERLCSINFAEPINTPLRNELDQLIQEIVRSLSYYKEKYGLESVEKVIISGGMAELHGIETHMANELKLKVEKINLTEYLQSGLTQREELEKYSSRLVSVVGLLMNNVRFSLNFLPEELKEKQELIQLRAPSLLTIIASGLFLFSVWGLINGQFVEARQKLTSRKQLLQQLQPLAVQLAQAQNKKNKEAQKLDFVQDVLNQDMKTVRFLAEISQAIPKSIFLDRINTTELTKEGRTGSQPAFNIRGSISASATAATDLADFILELKKSTIVDKVTLIFLSKKTGKVVSEQDFEILCLLVR